MFRAPCRPCLLKSVSRLKKQLRKLKREEKKVKRVKEQFENLKPADYLPTNPRLESALSVYLQADRDKRAHLEFLRQLINSELISLASPVGPWDPLDMKPQVFSLDTYFALPVFTSLSYLEEFCRRFHFSVRDPAGELWADWRLHPSDGFLPKNEESTQGRSSGGGGSGDGDNTVLSLQEEMYSAGSTTESCPGSDPSQRTSLIDSTHSSITTKHRFGFTQAAALPIFGPFVKPYFYGYFGHVDTIMYNISIVPEKVDVIVNPATPLEFVLGRDFTNQLAAKEGVLQPAYHAVESEIRSEFSRFFHQFSPEVIEAKSLTMAHQSSTPVPHHQQEYDILIIIDSLDFEHTMKAISQAKAQGMLTGHSSLSILNILTAPAHYVDAADKFFEGKHHAYQSGEEQSAAATTKFRGAFRRLGTTPSASVVTIATDVSPEAYYSDPELRHPSPGNVGAFRRGIR